MTVVVKCNDFYQLQDDKGKDLGKRCDIWYGLPQQSSYQFDYEKFKNKLNPRHLRIHSRHHAFEDLWDITMAEFNKTNQFYNFNYSVIEPSWYSRLFEQNRMYSNDRNTCNNGSFRTQSIKCARSWL